MVSLSPSQRDSDRSTAPLVTSYSRCRGCRRVTSRASGSFGSIASFAKGRLWWYLSNRAISVGSFISISFFSFFLMVGMLLGMVAEKNRGARGRRSIGSTSFIDARLPSPPPLPVSSPHLVELVAS